MSKLFLVLQLLAEVVIRILRPSGRGNSPRKKKREQDLAEKDLEQKD
ncbi:MAG: hypothetical protein ACRCSK_06080 [Fusobacteriaceae bacterium]